MGLGEIKQFACEASGLDANHLPCDGRALNRGTYSDLFALIGTIWGSGDGVSTFNIPLIGDFVRASSATRAVGSSQDSQNLAHSHSVIVNSGGTHAHDCRIGGSGSSQSSSWFSGSAVSNSYCSIVNDFAAISDGAHSHTGDASSSGGSESCPRNKAVLFAIQVFNDSSSGSQGLTEEQSIQLQKVSDFIDAIASSDYTKAFKFTGSDGREFYLTEELIKYCNQFK